MCPRADSCYCVNVYEVWERLQTEERHVGAAAASQEQQVQTQEQQAAQQALLLRVMEQQKEEMAKYREEMSHLLRKEVESPRKVQTLQAYPAEVGTERRY